VHLAGVTAAQPRDGVCDAATCTQIHTAACRRYVMPLH
jgi:hypothetical protein